jgi:hypothetical protein
MPGPRRRFWIDTEFIDHAPKLELISIGVVDEQDRSFYAISDAFDPADCGDWVQANVLPKLGDQERESPMEIGRRLAAFVGEDRPAFWGWCPSHDWVLLSWLYGGLGSLPKGWPGLCLTDDGWPKAPAEEHNALADARWTKEIHQHIDRQLRRRRKKKTPSAAATGSKDSDRLSRSDSKPGP